MKTLELSRKEAGAVMAALNNIERAGIEEIRGVDRVARVIEKADTVRLKADASSEQIIAFQNESLGALEFEDADFTFLKQHVLGFKNMNPQQRTVWLSLADKIAAAEAVKTEKKD